MPDPKIVPLTEPDSRRRLDSCTRGFTDRFGDRLLTFDRGSATPLELLRFKPELSGSSAFEEGLQDRVERSQVQNLSIAPARSVERWDGALVLVSRHVAGKRLAELLTEGRGPSLALEFLRQMTPALAALAEANGRFGHGALSLDRVVVGHDGRLSIVEHPLGTAVESLGWPVARLQSELGLAAPPAPKPVGFDSRIDPIQLGFVALSLMLNRRLDPAEYPAGASRLLDDSAEAKGGDTWAASRVRSWLERALQIGPRPFESAADALKAIGDLPADAELSAPPPVRLVKTSPPSPVKAVLPPSAPAPAPAAPVASPAPSTQPSSAKPSPAAPSSPAPAPAASSAPAAASAASAKPAPEPVAPAVVAAAKAAKAPKAPYKFKVLPWAFAAVSALALGEAIVLAGKWYFAPAPEVTTSPAHQAVLPPPIDPLPAPAPVPAAAQKSAPVSEPTPRPAETAAASGAPRFGGVNIVSPFAVEVFEGGKRLGASGGPIAILEGSHTIELVNETLGYRGRETVNIKPGELATRTIAVPSGRISINATPWADVWIDGSSAGQTPLANLTLPIGEHQITFRHPQFGDQRQTAVVKTEGVTRLSVTMQR